MPFYLPLEAPLPGEFPDSLHSQRGKLRPRCGAGMQKGQDLILVSLAQPGPGSGPSLGGLL